MAEITVDQLPANDGPERLDHANGCCCDECVDLMSWQADVYQIEEFERRMEDMPA